MRGHAEKRHVRRAGLWLLVGSSVMLLSTLVRMTWIAIAVAAVCVVAIVIELIVGAARR